MDAGLVLTVGVAAFAGMRAQAVGAADARAMDVLMRAAVRARGAGCEIDAAEAMLAFVNRTMSVWYVLTQMVRITRWTMADFHPEVADVERVLEQLA